MGDVYKSEQAQISAVEKEAKEKKHEALEQELAGKREVFFNQADEAGKLYAEAEKSLSDPKAKEYVKSDKESVRGHLVSVAEKGRAILASEKKDRSAPEFTSIGQLAGSIKNFVEAAKRDIPIFQDIEKAKGIHAKAKTDVDKALALKDPEKRKGMTRQEIYTVTSDALNAVYAADEVLFPYKPENFPYDQVRALYNAGREPILRDIASLASIRLENQSEMEKKDPNVQTLNSARLGFESVQTSVNDAKKIKNEILTDTKMSEATRNDKTMSMRGMASAAFDKLTESIKNLKSIDQKNLAPEYATLYQILLRDSNAQLTEIADMRLYCDTKYLVESGEMNKYFVFRPDGTVEETSAFKGLDVWKQEELLKQLHELPMKVQLEMEEKMATPEEKKLIEGKKKLAGGDWVGAKTDFLAYYNENVNKEGHDEVRLAQAKELLKQIAKLEIAQCTARLMAMKESIQGKFEWQLDPGGKSDYGTHNKDQAYMYLEDMSYVLVKAEEMIEKGEVLTIGDAELQLRKMSGNLRTSVQAVVDKQFELKEKSDDQLKKEKEEKEKRLRDDLERDKKVLADMKAGKPGLWSISGQDAATPENIEHYEKLMAQRQAQLQSYEKMDATGYRQLQTANLQREYNEAKLDHGLVRFNGGFGGASAVFDVFKQQRLLNEPDPAKREENILQLAKKARENGLPALARQYYGMYFQKELGEKAKHVNRADILKKFVSDDDNRENIDKQVNKWKEDFIKKAGREPTEAELDNVRGQMVSIMVDEAYSKEVKRQVHEDFQGKGGPRAEAWNAVYDKTVAVEDIGQSGTFTALFTDESWNSLPVKVAITTSIIIVSTATAGAALELAPVGSAALTLLGEGAVGRAVAFGANLAVESAVFSATEGALNGVINGDWSTFESGGAFMKSWGHTALTLGVLKGVGGGVGKLRELKAGKALQGMSEEAAAARRYMPGGASAAAGDLAWWAGRTTAESTALTGLAWAQAKMSGKPFGSREAFRSFGENVVFSVSIGLSHGITSSGHEASREKPKSKTERDLIENIDKASRLDVQAEAAREKAEAAKKAGSPDAAKLEAEAKRAESEAKGAEADLRRAEAKNRASELAEVQKTIDAMRKELERTDLSAEERSRLKQLVEHFEKAKTNGEELAKAERALFEEHRVIEVPDPANPGKTKKVDLFEHYNSKNFAYSKEMVDLMNNYDKLKKEGPKIIKHGGDEIVILHAGPDGKVQMFFGDVGNMGPTNEFALRVKGQDANMVDLYLREFSQIVRQRFKPGEPVDGPALLNEIKNNLSKKYFGIETKAEFDALAKQWGLEGTWDQYQTNMGNARILAGFRGSSRGLQKEFADLYGDKSDDPAQVNRDFAEFIDKKIQGLDTGSPPLTDILRQNLATMREKGALADLFPQGSEFNDVNRMNPATLEKILSKSAAERTAEENMMIYFALQRVDTAKIETISGMDAAGTQSVRDRFGKLRQPADMSTLMDFQMAGIDVPRFEGRDFNTADMKFFLDHVLEHGLHEAKKQKDKADIYQSENPFDRNGEIRADHPDAAKMKKAHEKAKEDKKADVIAETQKSILEAEKKLDALLKEMRSLREQGKLTEADEKRLADMIRESDALVQKINTDKYKDAETGADRPGKYNQDIAFWMRGRDGKPIEKQHQMYREFVIDMHNTGAINGQKGYATTDAAMRTIAQFMMARFPGATSIIRTGGGAFKLVYMDRQQLPQANGQPMGLVEHQAMIQAALPELNAKVQQVIAADANTVVDGSVRDATESFRRRGGVPSPVGQVDIITATDMPVADFGKARDTMKAPRTLYQIIDSRKAPHDKTPAQGPVLPLPAVPKALPKAA